MFFRSDAPTETNFTVDDEVYSGDSPSSGRVVSVDCVARTFEIKWADGDGGAITYPLDATYIRKKLPWE